MNDEVKAAKRAANKARANADRAMFLSMLRGARLPAPVPEYYFYEGRRWRFDFAWLNEKIALEVDGGLFVGGKHARGFGIVKDHEKRNEAALLGWRVYLCQPKELRSGAAFTLIQRAFDAHRKEANACTSSRPLSTRSEDSAISPSKIARATPCPSTSSTTLFP